jgi:hypothetical protein
MVGLLRAGFGRSRVSIDCPGAPYALQSPDIPTLRGGSGSRELDPTALGPHALYGAS